MKNNTLKMTVNFIFTALLVICSLHAKAAQAQGLRIGGVANVQFVDADHAVGPVSGGPFSALQAVVTARTPQANGNILVNMTHHFVTSTGGWIETSDELLMIPVPGVPGVFSISVNYTVVDDGGDMVGYKGEKFVSRGTIDSKNMWGSVRYDGTIYRHYGQ